MNISAEVKGDSAMMGNSPCKYQQERRIQQDSHVTVKRERRLLPKTLAKHSMPAKTVPRSLTSPCFTFRAVPGPQGP